MLAENEKIISLKPVLAMHDYMSELPCEEGCYDCEIKVIEGEVEVHEGAYDLETGCWDEAVKSEIPDAYVIHAGETKEFHYQASRHYGQRDQFYITNNKYLKPARLLCRYRREA